MFESRNLLYFVIALATCEMLVVGCGTDHAQARFVHAAPDAPSLDIAVDGKTLATALAYTGVAPAGSGYTTVDAGNRKLEERTTGTTTDLISSNVSFGTQKQYTILATGCVTPTNCNQASGTSTIAAVVLSDDNSAPSGGNVKLRVVHASASGPSRLDIYIVATGTDITSLSPTISSLAYQQAGSYQTVAPATNEVIVTATGDAAKIRIVDQSYTLAAGQIRTLVILDTPGGGAVSTTPLELSDLN